VKKKANKTIGQLRRFESRNVTFIEPDGSLPIVWERAKGMRVWDDDGREYLDFTAAFAVATAGHANPRIVAAGQRQMAKLLHAMGDVHPHALKADLARELSRLTFERLAKSTGKTIFCNSGFEAVEAALKTAHLATGRRSAAKSAGSPASFRSRASGPTWPSSSSAWPPSVANTKLARFWSSRSKAAAARTSRRPAF
jgi:4-aminobutyrate aminotransferase-like enzyme